MKRSNRSTKLSKKSKPNPRRTRQKKRTMPAAQVFGAPKQFQTIKTTGTGAIVRGCDLVYQIPDSLSTEFQNSQVISIIPCNPAYWSGTRVAAVASGYQNYRPLYFEVIYVPQCAVTQQGNVIGGTLWNQAPSTENLQQTLKTSNGGMLTQCYSKQNAIVKLGNNLQYNLFRMAGAIDQESNPFIYIALGVATVDTNNERIVPGYFYVRYAFQFKNPIGTGIQFSNSQLTDSSRKTSYLLNAVCYLCENILTTNGVTIPVGTRLDIEYNNNIVAPGYNVLYNGTLVDLALLRTIWILENQPIGVTTGRVKEVTRSTIEYTAKSNSGSSPTITLSPNEGVLFASSYTPNDWYTYLNNGEQTLSIPIETNTDYYNIASKYQDFGMVDATTTSGIIRFVINKLATRLIQV